MGYHIFPCKLMEQNNLILDNKKRRHITRNVMFVFVWPMYCMHEARAAHMFNIIPLSLVVQPTGQSHNTLVTTTHKEYNAALVFGTYSLWWYFIMFNYLANFVNLSFVCQLTP